MRFPVKKFLSYYRPYLGSFLGVLATAVIGSALALSFPLLVRYVTTDVLSGNIARALSEVYRLGGLMLVVVVLQNIANYIVDYKGHELGARIESDLRAELFAHLQRLSFAYYDKARTGQLMSRITNDLFLVAELYHHGPEDYVNYSLRFIGAFVILFSIDPLLTLAAFIFIPPLAVVLVYFNRILGEALRQNQERVADVNAQVEETFGGIRVVQSFATEDVEIAKFDVQNRRFLDSRRRTYKAEAYFYNSVQTIVLLISITIVVVGSIDIAHASLTLPDLLTFMLYVGYMTEPLLQTNHMTTQFQEGITGFRRFMEIMRVEPEVRSLPGALQPAVMRGGVEFRGVTFAYSGHEPVLRDLSLAVRPGEYIALVGPSGVGKTTLCSLIPRFYDVSEGQVMVDGVDVRELDLAWLRSHIGVVQQDVYLFAGTVADNIRYGRPAASDEEVMLAARRAHAHDFVTALPNGYQSEIGQRGVRLSGGQRQRLSIARVFLKDPPVLILDEATSSLDNKSERHVQAALESLAEGRTTIVVAHRLSTIRNAERIVVLTEQGVAEEGTHDALVARHGVYANLYAQSFAP